LLAGLQKIMST